jgi:hypothetical protein
VLELTLNLHPLRSKRDAAPKVDLTLYAFVTSRTALNSGNALVILSFWMRPAVRLIAHQLVRFIY